MTSVLICDDSAPVRDGLRGYVSGIPGVTRVDTAESGEEALARYPILQPGLVLMDVNMPGMTGVEATRRLVDAFPQAVVIVLTVAADREQVASAIACGARGYLSKDVSREELSAVVAHALAGVELYGHVGAAPAVPASRPGPVPRLTRRELQVLHGMSEGKSNVAIGRDLYLSEDTVKTHARRLFRKLGVNDRAQAVALGFRFGLVR